VSTWAFLGDSVTAAGRVTTAPDDLGRGWVAEVARRLHRLEPGARTVNLGVSGDRLADVRARAVTDLRAAGALVPDVVVTLAVGINDVRRAHLDSDPLDLAVFAAAYAALLDEVRVAVPGGAVRFVLVEPVLAPLDEVQESWAGEVDRVLDVVGSAARSTGAVRVGGVQPVLRAGPRETTQDGFHPTRAGHLILARAWWEAVAATPGLLPSQRGRWWDRWWRPPSARAH